MVLNQKAVNKINAQYECVMDNVYALADKARFTDRHYSTITVAAYAELHGQIKGYFSLMRDLGIITDDELNNLTAYFYKKIIGCKY